MNDELEDEVLIDVLTVLNVPLREASTMLRWSEGTMVRLADMLKASLLV